MRLLMDQDELKLKMELGQQDVIKISTLVNQLRLFQLTV